MHNQNTYHKAAIFTCNCCGYHTEAYSLEEWIVSASTPSICICKDCGKERAAFVGIQPLIYRNDIDSLPLHPYYASLPYEILWRCISCLGRDKIHWTELIIDCIVCKGNTMQFSGFTDGKFIQHLGKYTSIYPPTFKCIR